MAMTASELLARAGAAGAVTEVRPELCWAALERAGLGRLAVQGDGLVDIFPVNFVVDGTVIYLRTAPGSKLSALVARPQVALEIDAVDDRSAYSVVVKGRAELLESPSEIDTAETLPLTPWIPSRKLRWVRIRASEVTGRAFRMGTEPNSYP